MLITLLAAPALGAGLIVAACSDAPTGPLAFPLGRYVLVSFDGQVLPAVRFAVPDTAAQEIDSVYVHADTVVFSASDSTGPGSARFTERLVMTFVNAGTRRFEVTQRYGGTAYRLASRDSIMARGGSIGGRGRLTRDTLVIHSDDSSFSPGHTWIFVRR